MKTLTNIRRDIWVTHEGTTNWLFYITLGDNSECPKPFRKFVGLIHNACGINLEGVVKILSGGPL